VCFNVVVSDVNLYIIITVTQRDGFRKVILLSLCISVLTVLARESIFRLGYFSGFFLFVVTILTIMLYCTFRRIGLLSFYIYI